MIRRPVGMGLSTLTLVAVLALPASAQIGVGGEYVRAADAFGGTAGVGARLRLGVPLFPVNAVINGEYFFPQCPADDCSLRGVTFDLDYSLPIPVIHPWVGAGWSIRELKVGGLRSTRRGVNVGVGAELQLRMLRPFVDFRYEFVNAPEKQYVTRVGVMIH